MGKFFMRGILFVFVLLVFSTVTTVADAAAFRHGDYGQDVSLIQTRLSSLGYNVGTIDGDYGSSTENAVRAFQRDKGLEVDGIVGSQTYRILLGRDIPVSRGYSGRDRQIVQSAAQYIGVPYVFGGTSPDGFDCSGFTRYVFAQYGVYLPRTADEQYNVGRYVPYSMLQPGDMVFFTTYTDGVSHSGIYVGNGNFISATSSRGVAIARIDSGYWGARYVGARRIL